MIGLKKGSSSKVFKCLILFRKNGGQGRNRTTDTRIFSPLLYQLSYLAKFSVLAFQIAAKGRSYRVAVVRTGSRSSGQGRGRPGTIAVVQKRSEGANERGIRPVEPAAVKGGPHIG